MRQVRSWVVRVRFRRWIARAVRPEAFAAFGPNSVIHPPLDVARRALVEVGEGTYVLAGARIDASPGSEGVTIGDRTYLGRDLTILCGRRVVIGNDVMGSDRLYIADVEHEPGPAGAGAAVPRPVHVEDGVFLGTGAMILPGVRVGARSLVAAGAVVVEDVPPNAVVAGNPARLVRRFDAASATWVDGRGGSDQGVGVA